jgi:small nuclear ribonucleoprotein (snRNP)-like protein
MDKTFNIQKSLIIFGIPLFIIGIMILIAKSSIFSVNPSSLSIGITVDLLLTVPLVYFLLIRKTSIPKTTVVPFLIVGIVICSLILPAENQYYLNLFKIWVLPIVELSILSFIIYDIRKAIKDYKLNKNESFDFFTTLKNICYKTLPKGAVMPVATEIAVFYYGFIYWKKRKLKSNEFTYHKDSGTITLLVAIIFIVAIESVTFHILLTKWNNTVAWIFTFLSIYSGIQIFGFLKSMLKRPISIENNKLYLRYGIMTESIIDIENIESIELSSKDIETNKETRKLSFLGELESHNVIIRLKEEETLIGLYGISKKFKILALHVDNKIEFRDQINNALQQQCI